MIGSAAVAATDGGAAAAAVAVASDARVVSGERKY